MIMLSDMPKEIAQAFILDHYKLSKDAALSMLIEMERGKEQAELMIGILEDGKDSPSCPTE